MNLHTSRIDGLKWAQPAHQERSQRTLERLLVAAAAEIRAKGYADASVSEIARRAGCAVGTVYRRSAGTERRSWRSSPATSSSR